MSEYVLTEAADYLLTEDDYYIVTEASRVALEETLYADFQAALGAIATAYYEAAPDTASAPYIVWSLVDSVNDGLSLNSRSGIARFQIDCYATTSFEAVDHRNSVSRWAEAYNKTVDGVQVFKDSVSERSLRRGEDPLYRGVVDFTLTWRE